MTKRTFFRFWFPGLVLGFAVLSVTLLWTWPAEDWPRQNRTLGSYVAIGISFLVFMGWLLWQSRRVWWLGVGSLATLALLSWLAVERVEFDRDMVPIGIRFRWERSHDEVVEEHRRRQAKEPEAAPARLGPIETLDFPEYRGRRRDGVVEGPALARDWQKRPPRELWKQPIGGGHASFAVAGNLAVTIEQRRDREAVVAYDTETGRQRWAYDYPARFDEVRGGPGPRATPTLADGEVYSLGATGQLVCLNAANGEEKWSCNILVEDNANLTWGMCGSPLVYDNLVVVNPGVQSPAVKDRAVVAYDRKNGQVVWSAGNTSAGYSSPMLADLAGVRQVLMFDGEELAGYEANKGKKLWQHPWGTQQGINVAQPLVLPGGRVFISSAYDVGCAMLEIAQENGQWSVQELWRKKLSLRTKMSNVVAYQGYLYGIDDEIFECLGQKDGSRRWKNGDYGHGQPLLAGDLIVMLVESGELVLVEATPQAFHELGRFKALKGRTWNYPALANGKIFVRNHEQMACYDLRGE